ncbi:MAG: branched-chain amino acid ABC transporter permease [Vulcanimicrobiaceae bacterium]
MIVPRAVATAALVDFGFIVVAEGLGLTLLLVLLISDSYVVLCATVGAVIAGSLLLWRSVIGAYIERVFSRRAVWVRGVAALYLVLMPAFLGGNTYVYNLFILSALFAVVAVALNFQLGSANLPNFASGASYGIGAYVSALLMVHAGLGFWPALVIAAVVAAGFGFLLGVPCMRTRDYYLALVTIAFAVVVQQMLNNLAFTGGPNGIVNIPVPSIFGYSFSTAPDLFGMRLPSQANFYWLALATLFFAIFLGRRLHDSRIGLAWNAIGADPLAASCQGINVVWYKVLAFAVDAFLAACAGTVYASYTSYISPDDFTFVVSVTIMTMVIVGGLDNVVGVVAGAFILTVLPEKFRIFSDYRLLIYGLAVIVVMLIRPRGLIPRRLRRY